jgi:hypothetical protein
MSFLSRLFGSKSPAGAAEDIDAQLARLEAEAGTARPGYVGSAFNRAGDLALKAERPDQAVSYYGRGIDAFLEDGQRELARGVANKIIRVRPTAIRTLCTLTWLDLAARHQATALLHLRDYSAAAKEASQGDRAATHMYAMARVSPDSQFVDAVADALDSLDFVNRAKEVRSWATGGAPDAIVAGEALSEACVAAALGSNSPDTLMLSDEMGGATEDDSAELSEELAEEDSGGEVSEAGSFDADSGSGDSVTAVAEHAEVDRGETGPDETFSGEAPSDGTLSDERPPLVSDPSTGKQGEKRGKSRKRRRGKKNRH